MSEDLQQNKKSETEQKRFSTRDKPINLFT